MFRHHVSAPRKLAMLAAAAAVALGLSACGGGGGGGTATGGGGTATGGSGGGPSGPSGGGGPTSTAQKEPSLTAGGVTVGVRDGGGGSFGITITKGGTPWTVTANNQLAAPTGWTAVTRLNSGNTGSSHRFHVVHDIASLSDADYLAYGHWSANFPSPPAEKPDFESFFYGKLPYTGNVPASTPTATYTGGAAGIYKTGTPGAWGYFKSDISLEANFGTGKVTATLSGFGVVSALSPSFSFSDVTMSAATISGSSFTAADWGGRFFGPAGAAPTGAAGWFENLVSQQHGGTGSATLYGSFAANK